MSHPGFFEHEGDDGLTGVRIGIVTNNEDPKDLGRVKLRFPWRDADDESYWARIATPMAGKGYGAYFLPEVDDEVLVSFEDGDIHKPFVLGALWNGSQKPPQKNKDGKNDVRQIESRSGHTVTLDDSKDEGNVEIETEAGHTITLDDTSGSEKISIEDETGKNAITLDSASGAVSIEADSKIDLSAPTVNVEGGRNVSVSAKQGLSLTGKSKATLSSKGNLTVKSQALMKVQSSGPLSIKGALIQLN